MLPIRLPYPFAPEAAPAGGTPAAVNGQTLTLARSVLAGQATARATAGGMTAGPVAFSVLAGTVRARATVAGRAVTINTQLAAGVAFVPSTSAGAPRRKLHLAIGLGL